MIRSKLLSGAAMLLAAPAAFAGTVAGVPAGGRLGFAVGNLFGVRVGEFLPVAVPGLLAVAGGALAVGIFIIRRKRGR